MRLRWTLASSLLLPTLALGTGLTTDDLLARLRSGSRDERVQALVGLSQTQEPTAALLDALVEMLSDGDSEVRRAAAYAVAHIAIALGCEAQSLDGCPQLEARYEALPKAKKKVPPTYPDTAKRIGQQGAVVMQMLVGEDGKVRDIRVVSGPELLRDTAVETLKAWTYEPARWKGHAVPFVMVFTMRWKLS